MKRIILLITIFSSLLFSDGLTFTQKELQEINNHPQKNAILNRYKALNNLTKELKDKNLTQKLIDVNLFFNQTLPMLDNNRYNIDDHWSTPKEFIINGEGDCEDYAIAKYFTLLKLGVQKKDLYFAVVKLERRSDFHMVLLYDDKKNNQLLVLDNLSFRILPLKKRVDLAQIAAFNEYESKKLANSNLKEDITLQWADGDKWAELLHRIYSKNE